jgi:hypothetical protein
MQINVTAAAMVGGKVDHGVNTVNGRARDAGLAEIGFNKFNFAGSDMPANVVDASAGEIIHNADFCAAIDQAVGNV